jgi:hypothetical protein
LELYLKTYVCDCGKVYIPNPKYKDNRVKCDTCIKKTKAHEVKKKAVEYLGGKCIDCGYNEHIVALDFDHIYPEQKEFKISGSAIYRWDELKRELDKCVIRCSNHHRIRHYMDDHKKLA